MYNKQNMKKAMKDRVKTRSFQRVFGWCEKIRYSFENGSGANVPSLRVRLRRGLHVTAIGYTMLWHNVLTEVFTVR